MVRQALLNLIKFIFRSYFLLFYKVKVTGLENIPQEGGLIMACNHMSNFDPPFAGGFAGKKRGKLVYLPGRHAFKNGQTGQSQAGHRFYGLSQRRAGFAD